jgi:hypothetical protein
MRQANLNVRVAHAERAVDHGARVEAWFDNLDGRIEAALADADRCCLAVAWIKSRRLINALPKGRTRLVMQSETHCRPLDGIECRKVGLARGGADRPLMHNKFCILKDADERTFAVLTGSYNYTSTATRSLENVVCIRDAPNVFAAYEREFDQLWRVGRRITNARPRSRRRR